MTEQPTDPGALPIFATKPARPPTHRPLPPDAHLLAGPPPPRAPRTLHVAPEPIRPGPLATISGTDWQQVAVLRAQASDQLTAALGEQRGMDKQAERDLGRTIIGELLRTTAADRVHDGQLAWTMQQQDALADAVFNTLFGLGRLQPLVDDDTVENIIITGADTVWLEKTDGSLVRAEPVADSDQELLEFLAFLASRSENARSFSSTNPHLHMRLEGHARLAAAAWVTSRPSVVIRRHRLVRITLDDLAEMGMITGLQATFLRAAVRANKSIVVGGEQGAGKTTMVRALCAEIAAHEGIGTFETEFELLLHEMPDLHPIVHAWESRPGSGELGPGGRSAGEFTLMEALNNSFRFNLRRQIVGEVRGPEAWAMIKAMESSAGSISTTHATDAEGAMRKLVSCAMEAGQHVTHELATAKLSEMIDLVVQVHLETTMVDQNTFTRSRWVSEIVHVTPGESVKGYSTTHVFGPNPSGGPGLPGTLPDQLRALDAFGFDLGGYLRAEARSGVPS